jgi:hypothetical protein
MGNELPLNHKSFFPANRVIWLESFFSSQAIFSELARSDLVAITKNRQFHHNEY